MKIGSRHIINTLAVALTLIASACATTEEAGDLGTTESELGIPPTGGSGNKFHWNAYEKKPYIYKGCPDPGPEPWAEKATLMPRVGTRVLELELGTAVPLNLRALSLARGVTFTPNSRGATIAVDNPSIGDPLGMTLLVTSGACSYEIEAEIAYQ